MALPQIPGEYALTAAIAGSASFALGAVSSSVGGSSTGESTSETGTSEAVATAEVIQNTAENEGEVVYITQNDYLKYFKNQNIDAIQKVLESGKSLKIKKG